jgi:4,4'-diaponeurosporenoate glycosyltransferase
VGTVSLALLLIGLVASPLLVLRTPPLPARCHRAAGPQAAGRRHVVVVPARDEADVLPALLGDLAAQDVPASRIVVVDDGSRDATASVAASYPGVEVRRSRPTPPGWNPKSWALHQGVDDGTEEVLVFLDADVRLAPGALAAVLAAHDRHRGLVSVAPRHDVGSPAEWLSLPFNLVAVMGAGAGWTPRTAAGRAAFGPCLVIDRAGYCALGGHAADHADLLDDVALARRARSAGVPVSLYRGGTLVRYRMYRQGVRQVLDGWTKNIAAGARRTPAGPGLGAALWVTAVLVPLVALASARTLPALGGAVAAWAVVAAHTRWLSRAVGRFPPMAAALAPLLGLVFVAVVARSALALALRRPVRWKGRRLVQTRGEVAGG